MRFRYSFQNNVTIIKQEIASVFVIPEIIKVSVSVVTASAISSAEVASAYVGEKFLFGTVIINYSYFCLLSNTNQTDRLLHGQGPPTGFSHELVMYQKSNELAQRILHVFQVTIEARYKPSEA